jgi:hypothetical protein
MDATIPAMAAAVAIGRCTVTELVEPALTSESVTVAHPSIWSIDWTDLPTSNGAQELGRRWLQSNSDLIMLVP